MRLVFFTAVMIAGIVASLWSRFAALLTYVWFALFRPQEWMWINVDTFRLSFVVGFLLVVPSLLTGVLPNLTHPLTIGTALFLLSAFMAQMTTELPAASWPWLDGFIRLAVVVMLSVTILNSRLRIKYFIVVMAGSIGFHTAKAGVVAMMSGGVYFAEGLGGAFVDNNSYALAAAVTLPMLICVWQIADRTSRIERWLSRSFLVAVPLTLFMIIGTMSRTGFLAAGTVAILFVVLQYRRLMPLAGLALVVMVALPYVPMPKGYLDRMETIQTYDETNESSALSRLHFWKVAQIMAAANPLGVGLKNFDGFYDRYDFLGGEFGRGRSVHSSHFQVLAEQGYFGAFVWVSLFAGSLTIAFRVRRMAKRFRGFEEEESRFFVSSANATITAIAAFIVGGSFIASSLNDLTWYTFGLVAAIDRVASARRRELESSVHQTEEVSEAVVEPRRRATA